MKLSRLLLVCLALGASLSPAHAAGPGAMVVVATASAFSCPPGSGDVTIQGVNDLGNDWTFTFDYVNASGGVVCLHAGLGDAEGTWNPASGGWVTGISGSVFISAVPSAGTPTSVAIQVCVPLPCYSGSGIAVRA